MTPDPKTEALKPTDEDHIKALAWVEEDLRDEGYPSYAKAIRKAADRLRELSAIASNAGTDFAERLRKAVEERDALARWREDHLRILDVSNEHFREARAKVAHLWTDIDQPGIDGICTKLAEVSQQLAAVTAERDEITKLLPFVDSEGPGAYKRWTDLMDDLSRAKSLLISAESARDALAKRIAELEAQP